MVTRLSATELSRSLSYILNRVHYQREEFVIERNGETVAIRRQSGALSRTTLRTRGESLAHFTFGDAEFADDVESIQRDQQMMSPPAWPSS